MSLEFEAVPSVEDNFCVECGANPSRDCGFGEYISTTDSSDFDCISPDSGYLECPCYHTWCEACRNKPIITDGVKLVVNPELMEEGKEYGFEYLDMSIMAIKDKGNVDIYHCD